MKIYVRAGGDVRITEATPDMVNRGSFETYVKEETNRDVSTDTPMPQGGMGETVKVFNTGAKINGLPVFEEKQSEER